MLLLGMRRGPGWHCSSLQSIQALECIWAVSIGQSALHARSMHECISTCVRVYLKENRKMEKKPSAAYRLRGGAASLKKKCMRCKGSFRLRTLTWLSCTSIANQLSAELLRAPLPLLPSKKRPLLLQQTKPAKPCRPALATCCWPRCLLFFFKYDDKN